MVSFVGICRSRPVDGFRALIVLNREVFKSPKISYKSMVPVKDSRAHMKRL